MFIPQHNCVKVVTAQDLGLTAADLRKLRIAQYVPMYMGYSEEGEQPYFLTADDPTHDGEGWDVDGNSSGHYRVWDGWDAFKAEHPHATFDKDGNINGW